MFSARPGRAERARRAVEPERDAEDQREADLRARRLDRALSQRRLDRVDDVRRRARVAQVLRRVGDQRLLAEQAEHRDRRRAAPGTATSRGSRSSPRAQSVMPCALEDRERVLERTSSGPACRAPGLYPAGAARGSSACPSSTARARRRRPCGCVARACARSSSNAARSSIAVALHEHALGPLDHRAPVQRALELVDLLGQPRGLGVPRAAPPRSRSAAPPPSAGRRTRRRRARPPGATNSGSSPSSSATTGPDANARDLGDEVERVLVVAVHDDDRDVGVLVGDAVGRPRRRRPRTTVTSWPSSASSVGGRAQRLLVLVRGEDPQAVADRPELRAHARIMTPSGGRPPAAASYSVPIAGASGR